MDLRLDKSSPIPIGIQIKEQIKMLINSGEYTDGSKLPPITALASTLKVNKNTIVTVFKELESEGYIKSHRGKGVFVQRTHSDCNINAEFVGKVDILIREANRRNIQLSEVLNIINARFDYVQTQRKIKALFLMNVSRKLVELNLEKLRANIPEVEFEGVFLRKDITYEELYAKIEAVDYIIIPSIIYDHAKHLISTDKPIVKTVPELSGLQPLKKGIEKKSKVAVIGANRNGAQLLGNMFVSERIFKPKMMLALNEVEKMKKELKEIESFVICITARDAVDKIKLKGKNVYFFSDYLCKDSLEKIREVSKELAKSRTSV